MSEPKLYCVKRPDGSFVWETLWYNQLGAINMLFNRAEPSIMEHGRWQSAQQRIETAKKLGYRIVRAAVVEVEEPA